MNDIMIGVVLAAIAAVIFLIVMMRRKGKSDAAESNAKELLPTTQDHLALKYIRSGIVALKNGGYRLLVELPSLNIELMEIEEKEIVLEQYKQILNAIDYPFQFFQQSRIVDISEYLSTVEKELRMAKNPLIGKQLEYYADFLADLIRDRSILTKSFYLVVPYDEEKEVKNKSAFMLEKQKLEKKKKKKTDKDGVKKEDPNDILVEEKKFDKARKQLYSRGDAVCRAFRRLDISPHVLDDQELLELFYTSYNKDRSVIQSLRNKEITDYTSLRVKAQRRDNI